MKTPHICLAAFTCVLLTAASTSGWLSGLLMATGASAISFILGSVFHDTRYSSFQTLALSLLGFGLMTFAAGWSPALVAFETVGASLSLTAFTRSRMDGGLFFLVQLVGFSCMVYPGVGEAGFVIAIFLAAVFTEAFDGTIDFSF